MDIISQYPKDTLIMRIEKVINRLKEFLLWTYVAALLGGIVYAACTGQHTKTPAEIIYEKTHTR